jgi:restriction system protein
LPARPFIAERNRRVTAEIGEEDAVPAKKRKPAGLTGFIADAISDQNKAAETTKRLEAKADIAWAGVAAKASAAEARERVKLDARAARQAEVDAGNEEAEAVTRTLQSRVAELETLLAVTLDQDPYLPFDRLKEPAPRYRFEPPVHLAEAKPAPRLNLPESPKGLAALTRKREHARVAAQWQAAYEQEAAEHARAEQDRLLQLASAKAAYESALATEKERVRGQHVEIDRLAVEFAEGNRNAVTSYFREVLSVQNYPADFPTGIKVAYKPSAHEIVISIDLPLLTVIPEHVSCEYQPVKKDFRYKKRTVAERNKLYQQIVAQMTLRALRSVILADRQALARTVACNGYVDFVSKATGKPSRECLVSVHVDRDEFLERIDLAHVDPVDCLTYLHAKFSQTPEKYFPVQPIIDYPWDDLPYADEADAVTGLDSVKNLLDLNGYEFEDLILDLCNAIPEFNEVRKTRSRKDGGIDLVAVNTKDFVGGRVAIQAKCNSSYNKVGVPEIREAVGSITQRDFNRAIIITTSTFTADAREEASRLGVLLYEGEQLLWLLRHHLHREYTIIDRERRKAPIKKPPQPRGS